PPPQEPVTEVELRMRPVGRVSLKATPCRDRDGFGLLTVKLKLLVVPFTGMNVWSKDLLMPGGFRMSVGSSWVLSLAGPIWSVEASRFAVLVTCVGAVGDTFRVSVIELLIPTGRALFRVQLTPEVGGWQVQPLPLTPVSVN